MAFKIVILCAFAVMVQTIAGQKGYRPIASSSSPSSSPSSSCGCASIAVSDNGGPLSVTSVGPITPTGIALATELGLKGDLDISGALPYLSAVAFEGQFDTKGSTPLSYGCGDCVAITQELGNPSGNNAAVSSGQSGLSASSINTCGCLRRA